MNDCGETYVYDLYSKDGVVYLFGIDRDGGNTIVRVSDFRPWFVVELPEPVQERLMDKVDERHSIESLVRKVDRHNQNIIKEKVKEICSRKKWEVQFSGKHAGHLYYANRPKAQCLIITMETSDNFRYLRAVILKQKPSKHCKEGFKVHELRTPPILQFGCQTGISMCGWVKFAGSLDRQDGRKTFWDCSVKQIRQSDTTDSSPEPTIMYFDLETYTSNIKCFPDPNKNSDVIFQASVVITGYVRKSYLLTLGKPKKNKDYKTIRYKSERDLVIGLCELINRHDPNLITGYNIHGFDWRYIFIRADKLGIDHKARTLINMLPGPATKKETKWSTAQSGEQYFIYPEMPGRIPFDLLPYMRREFSKDFRRYKLDIVAGKLLGAGKDPITPVDIHNSYRQAMKGDYTLLSEVGKYCVKDSELVRDLFLKLDIWTMLTQSSIVMNITAKDLYIKGQQIRIYCQVYKYCYDNNIVIDESSYVRPKVDSKYEGACVLVPQPGMYSNVVPFDFCLSGDTKISLRNGTSVQLENIRGNEVVSTFIDGRIGANRVVGGLQRKGVRDTVKISLCDGTEIISTPEHKFLLEDGTWCEAQYLKNQRIKMGIDYPLDSRGEDEVGWSLQLNGVTFTMSDHRNKLLAFSRLLGFVLSDGSLGSDSEYDSQRVMDDIELICGKRTTYRESSKLLSKMFHSLDGIVIGKRGTQPMSLPSFLTEKSCPKSVIREFLAGLFGGDASVTSSQSNSIGFKWATLTKYAGEMKVVFQQLISMLALFDVSGNIIQHPPVHQNPIVNLMLRIRQDSIENFSSTIGFRYCIHKTAKLDIVTRYLRYCQLIFEKIPNPTFRDFINQLGVGEWFSTVKKYLDIPSYSIRVVDILEHKPQEVYDIEVSQSHNFLANGAVAHNCSLYPTIIVAYNICYSTLVKDEAVVDDRCHVIEWDDEQGLHHRHRFIKSPMGVIPTIIQNLLNKRADTKRELKRVKAEAESSGDPEQAKLLKSRAGVLDKRQLSFKISANSMYGGMGVKEGYLPCREAASSVTAKGRQELMNAKRILETHFDARVIYGDSVLGDTPILVRTSDGHIDIRTIETLGDAWNPYEEFKSGDSNRREKQQSEPNVVECWTSNGWSRIRRVIKHRSCKKIYRVSTHCGVVDVTEDHSLLNRLGEKIKPQECIVNSTRLLTGLPMSDNIQEFVLSYPSDKLGCAKLYYMAHSLGYYCRINITPDGQYQIQCGTEPIASQDVVQDITLIHEAYTDFVYDIETVTGNFQAGIGNIILKNTDSCYVVFDDYKGDDLFQYSKQIDDKINENNAYFPWPMVLEFEEEVYRQFLILKKKCYMWRTSHSNDVGKKGGMLVRRDVSRFEQMVYENVVNMIFDNATITDVTCYVVDQFNMCCGGNFSPDLFTISSSVKDVSSYKIRPLSDDGVKRQARLDRLQCDEDGYADRALPRHVQLAQRMKERGTPVDVGERIEYLLTTQADHKAIQADRIEEIDYFKKHRGLINVDYVIYINRIANNLDELIDVVFKVKPLVQLKKHSTKIIWTMKCKDGLLTKMCSHQFKLRVQWNKVIKELNNYFKPFLTFGCRRHNTTYQMGSQCDACSN
jgi:DNA polymerase elongation subunit (family B)